MGLSRFFFITAGFIFLSATVFADTGNCPDLHAGLRANVDDSIKIADQVMSIRSSGSVFGKEAAHYEGHERFMQEGENKVFQMIGKLEMQRTSKQKASCTATLVGECHLLTAGHCLSAYDANGKMTGLAVVKTVFTSSDGKTDAGATAIEAGGKIGLKSSQNRANDWGFVALNAPIGRKLGWMGVKNVNENEVGIPMLDWKGESNSNFISAGFSSDIEDGDRMSVEPRAEIINPKKKGVVNFRGDFFFGGSGGPLFRMNNRGEPEIYAVQSAVPVTDKGRTYDEQGRIAKELVVTQLPKDENFWLNEAVTSSSFLAQLKKFIEENPCPKAAK